MIRHEPGLVKLHGCRIPLLPQMTYQAESQMVYLVVSIAETKNVTGTRTRHGPVSLDVGSSHADVKDLGTVIWVPSSNDEGCVQLLLVTHLRKHLGSCFDVRQSSEFNAVSVDEISDFSGSILRGGGCSGSQYYDSVVHIVDLICCSVDNEAGRAGSCFTPKDLRESAAAMTPPLNLTAMMVVPIRSCRYGSKDGSCICVCSIILKNF